MSNETKDEIRDDEVMSDDEAALYLAEVAGYDKWPEGVGLAFDRALCEATVQNVRVDFDEAVAKYRAIESEFLPRVGIDEENAKQVRRHIVELILDAALVKQQPFEVARQWWNTLVELGFYRLERQCRVTWSFASACIDWGQKAFAREILAPLIAELERLQAASDVTASATEYYRHQLDLLRKLYAQCGIDAGGE